MYVRKYKGWYWFPPVEAIGWGPVESACVTVTLHFQRQPENKLAWTHKHALCMEVYSFRMCLHLPPKKSLTFYEAQALGVMVSFLPQEGLPDSGCDFIWEQKLLE